MAISWSPNIIPFVIRSWTELGQNQKLPLKEILFAGLTFWSQCAFDEYFIFVNSLKSEIPGTPGRLGHGTLKCVASWDLLEVYCFPGSSRSEAKFGSSFSTWVLVLTLQVGSFLLLE